MSLNLSGLSGYDFSGIIQGMVDVYKLPQNRMVEKKSVLQTQKDTWRDINTRLSALNNTLTVLKTASTWTATTVASSNSSVVTATSDSNAIPGIYDVDITFLALNEISVSKETDDTAIAASMPAYTTLTATSSNWDFSINGKTVFVQRSAASGAPTLNDIANSINRTQDVGVKASIIEVSEGVYRLSISGNTGLDNQITFADPNSTLANAFGFTFDMSGHVNTALSGSAAGYTQQARDASFQVNGVPITSSSNKVTTAIPGVTLDLASAGSSNITISTDISVAQNAVQAFVDQYNSAMSFIKSKLDYDADTKKAGDLFGDPLLQGIELRLRGIVGRPFANQTAPFTLLSEIGISTTGRDAQLTFDTAKFAKKMSENPKSIANLFSAPYDGITPSDTEGVYNSLHDYLDPLIKYKGRIAVTQDNYSSQIEDIEDRIQANEERALEYEERLKKQFAALESALSNLNTQGAWLNSQVNAMSAAYKK